MCITGECNFCKVLEDVEHFLMHCHKYSASRLSIAWALRSCLLPLAGALGLILGGSCSGPRQRAIL